MNDHFDIIIIGGGIAGLALANSLKNSDLQVLLLERKPKFIDVNRGDTLYSHSIDLLEKWGVLEHLLQNGAVKSDKISIFQDKRNLANINIISPQRYKNNFLLSLNHELIEKSLYDSLANSPNIKIMLGANVVDLIEENGIYTSVKYMHEGKENFVFANSFAASDGRDSFLRKKCGINYSTTDFDHDIMILNSTPPMNYNGQTWFYYGSNHEIMVGPLPQNRIRLSVILKKDESHSWMGMSNEEIKEKINLESDIFKDCEISKAESHLYEVKMSLAERFSDKNLVFIGDSAHTVHPISGQGMALAISDADILSGYLKNQNLKVSESLESYSNERFKIVSNLMEHVANLGNLMISEQKVVDMARIFLLNNLEVLPMFERQIEAMLQSEVERF